LQNDDNNDNTDLPQEAPATAIYNKDNFLGLSPGRADLLLFLVES
jgi:hypothetical protein